LSTRRAAARTGVTRRCKLNLLEIGPCRDALFIHACGQCHRQFQDHSIDRFDVETWLASNLDAEVLPDSIMWMDKPVKWKPPGDG
jgi:hypothetical protein